MVVDEVTVVEVDEVAVVEVAVVEVAVVEVAVDEAVVVDEGLVHLKRLTNLESHYLGDTQVTDAGLAAMQQTLPNCYIKTW